MRLLKGVIPISPRVKEPDTARSAGCTYYYENHIHADPHFPIIFHLDRVNSTSPTFGFHWHEGVEILFFLEGEATVYSDAVRLRAEAGCTVVINSNHLHAIYSPPPGCLYFCLIVDKNFCQGFGVSISNLVFSSLINDPLIRAYFERIAEEKEREQPYYTAAITAEVVRLMIYLCRNYAEPQADTASPLLPRHHIDTVKHTIRFIGENYMKPITLDEICARVGFSKYYLCRTFKRATGQTIIDYLNLQRCRNARSMLLSGDATVAECAEACGYNSPSYFTRQYKKYIGELPSQHREH